MIAAWFLIRGEDGAGAAKRWLREAVDLRRHRPAIWIAATLLLMPLVMAASFAWLRLEGASVPLPVVSLQTTVLLFLAFFVFALAEELGWSGYAIDPMQDRWGALRAALALGAVWADFHFVALAQAGRSIGWIAWRSLGTVASRVVIVWLYNNLARSILIAALFHAMQNLTWQLFPVQGSYYGPRITGLIMLVIAMTVACPCRARFTATSWGFRRARRSPPCWASRGRSMVGERTTSSTPIRWRSSTATWRLARRHCSMGPRRNSPR